MPGAAITRQVTQPPGNSTCAMQVWAHAVWGRVLFCSESRHGSYLATDRTQHTCPACMGPDSVG